jgi:hypothetical protein
MEDDVLYKVFMAVGKPSQYFTEFVSPGTSPSIGNMYVGKIMCYDGGDALQFLPEPDLPKEVCHSVERRMHEIKRSPGRKRPRILRTLHS